MKNAKGFYMNKKWFAALAAIILATVIPFVLSSCDSEDSEEKSASDYLYITNGTLMTVDKTKCPANVTIPDGITAINAEAFSYCMKLESVVIPNGVTNIGNSAFFGCTSLKSVTLPSSVTNIGDLAFSGCTNLTIYYKGTKAQWENITKGSQAIPSNATIQYSDGSASGGNSNDDNGPGGTPGMDEEPHPTSKLEGTSLYRFGATNLDCNFDGAGILTNFGGAGSYLYYPVEIDLDNDTAQLSATISVTEAVDKMGIGFIIIDDNGFVDSYVLATTASSVRYFGGTKAVDADGNPKENGYAWENGSTLGLTTGNDPKPKLLTANVPYTFTVQLKNGKFVFTIADSSDTVAATLNARDYSLFINNNGKVYLAIGAISGDTSKIMYSDIKVIINDGECTIDSIKNSDISSIAPYLVVSGRTVTGYRNDIPAELTIPNGITAIGSNAFKGCNTLKTVTIPTGVTTISSNAFRECASLTTVVIPDGVTAIGNSAFWCCNALEYINIPTSVKSIGNDVFTDCSLTNVTIPYGVESIGKFAFCDNKLLTSIIIPDSVTSLGPQAFWYCESLTSVTISQNVTEIDFGTFQGCYSLTSVVIPDGVTSIGNSAFKDCRSLTSVTIPKSVTTINNGAFQNCTSLQSVNIPNGITEITANTFEDCTLLASVTIPNSVKTIGESAFNGCKSMDIYYDGKMSEWQQVKGYDTIPEHISVHCSDTPSYLIVKGTKITGCDKNNVPENLVIPDGITEIGESAFNWCESLVSVTIPDSVTKLDKWAFCCCKALKSIEIPKSVTAIGDFVFDGCDNLERVVISANLTAITNSMFQNCDNLTDVNIPGSVTSIEDNAFRHCSGLKNVEIPSNVTSIGNSAFEGCTGLTSITIPSSVTEIGKNAFIHTNIWDIYYAGTKELWEKISTNIGDTPTMTIHCTDGDIRIKGKKDSVGGITSGDYEKPDTDNTTN